MDQLIVLGNGFDLSVGLQTRYTNFFNYLKVKFGEIEQTYLVESSIPLSQNHNKWNDNFDFWSLWFQIIEGRDYFKKGLVEWSDVETQIKKALVYLCKYNRSDDDFKKTLEHVTKSISSSEQTTSKWWRSYEETLDFYFKGWLIYLDVNSEIHENKIDIYDFLFKDLDKFEKKFATYLCDEVINQENISNLLDGKNNALHKRRSLLKKIQTASLEEIKETQILCFNYTPIFETRFTEDEEIHIGENIRYIHGSIKADDKENKFVPGQIIFGIDDTSLDFRNGGEKVAESIYRFGKTYRIMNLKDEFSLDLNRKIGAVKFYGHSLNEADYAYFQSIFDKVDLYGSNVKLYFYYGNFENDNKEYKRIFMDRIYKLIETYGQNTFKNASEVKGKNLLHKLLLEGRIKTEYVSFN